ncbi:MAG TPA: hypothetical protein V6C78_17255 [Crinalium sp.]|jgi:chromosome segregation ATPase
MRRNIAKGSIRPKISTMPRQKTEASILLDLYKLMVEKKRLQQELQSLDERRQQICSRVAIIEQRTTELEQNIQYLRGLEGTTPQPKPVLSVPHSDSGTFETIFLEY